MAVVVPAHNEEGFVGDVVRSVPAFVDRVFVVDDGSTDGTWGEVRSAAGRTATVPALATNGAGGSRFRRTPGSADGARAKLILDADRPSETARDAGSATSVVAVRHAVNLGRGASIKTGYRLALADGHDVIAVMDGDGQMDPAILDHIVGPVARGVADYAKGDRLRGRPWRDGMSTWRLFGNLVLTGLTRIASGYWGLRDPQNGYTAISAAALEAIDLDGLYDGYGFLNDMLIALNAERLRVATVPMRARYGDESSGITYRSFVPSLSGLLLRGFLWRVTVALPRPNALTVGACYLLSGLGLMLGAVSALGLPIAPGPSVSDTGTVSLALGVLLFVAAVLLDRRRNAGLEVTMPPAFPERTG